MTATTMGDLGKRIERLYRAHPDGAAAEEHGERRVRGQVWFARRAGVDPRTVRRWVRGERRPPGPVLALLAVMEREAGVANGGRESCTPGLKPGACSSPQ